MQIQYIGRKARHRDLLYGTRQVWDGSGDVQDVPEKVGATMLRKHPDVYAAPGTGPSLGDADGEPTEGGSDQVQNDGSGEPQGSGDESGGDEGHPEGNGIEIEVNGEWISLHQASRAVIADYAMEHFGVDLDRRKKAATLAAELEELLATTQGDSE